MHEWKSLLHVRWECKYHVVIIPKYRRKVLCYMASFAATWGEFFESCVSREE